MIQFGLLGWFAFSPKVVHYSVHFQSGRDNFVQAILDWLFWHGSECNCHVIRCLNEPNCAITKSNYIVGLNNALVCNEEHQRFELFKQTQPHATSLPPQRAQGLFSLMKNISSRSHLSILILLINTGFVASALPILTVFLLLLIQFGMIDENQMQERQVVESWRD